MKKMLQVNLQQWSTCMRSGCFATVRCIRVPSHHLLLMADIRMVRSEVQKRTEGSSRTRQNYNAQQTGHPPRLRQSHYSSMLCLCACCRFFSSCLVKMVSSRLAAKVYNLMQMFLFPYVPFLHAAICSHPICPDALLHFRCLPASPLTSVVCLSLSMSLSRLQGI